MGGGESHWGFSLCFLSSSDLFVLSSVLPLVKVCQVACLALEDFMPRGGGLPFASLSEGVLQRPVTWRGQVRSHPPGAGNLEVSPAPALQEKTGEAEHWQDRFAAAPFWKVWPGATLPVHHSPLRWAGVMRRALGLLPRTTVHTLPSSITLPPHCHWVLSKLHWSLDY